MQRFAISTELASALGRSAKSRLHLGLRLEVLLAAEALDAARIGEHLAVGDADARLVRLVVVGAQELHRVRRDDRQAAPRGELDRGAHVRLVAGQAAALHLDVEAARKPLAEALGDGVRARVVAGEQGAAERAGVGARERDQAFGALGEPRPFDDRVAAGGVLDPGAREQLAQIEIAGPVLDQERRAGCTPSRPIPPPCRPRRR